MGETRVEICAFVCEDYQSKNKSVEILKTIKMKKTSPWNYTAIAACIIISLVSSVWGFGLVNALKIILKIN